MKKGIFIVTASILVTALLIGIALLFFRCSSDDEFTKEVALIENNVTKKDLEFSATGIKPGDSRQYTLRMKSPVTRSYTFTFSFEEEENGGLAQFIQVTLEYADQSEICMLSELFGGKTYQFDCEVTGGAYTDVHLTFTMPAEVGNEAQGATSDFLLHLEAESE